MKAELINPFLVSASNVIEQVIQIRPKAGKLEIKNVKMAEDYTWIQIGMSGQMQGDIVFGLHETVALRMVSAMMGGFDVTEMDDMSRSAISELSNMISGNASTLLYNQGVQVEISPPQIVEAASAAGFVPKKALMIPLIIGEIGQLDILVIVL